MNAHNCIKELIIMIIAIIVIVLIFLFILFSQGKAPRSLESSLCVKKGDWNFTNPICSYITDHQKDV